MKQKIVSKNDSFNRAIKALKERKTAIAVVYGYSRKGEFHPDCIVIYDNTKLKELQHSFSSKKNGGADTTIYTLFRNQISE